MKGAALLAALALSADVARSQFAGFDGFGDTSGFGGSGGIFGGGGGGGVPIGGGGVPVGGGGVPIGGGFVPSGGGGGGGGGGQQVFSAAAAIAGGETGTGGAVPGATNTAAFTVAQETVNLEVQTLQPARLLHRACPCVNVASVVRSSMHATNTHELIGGHVSKSGYASHPDVKRMNDASSPIDAATAFPRFTSDNAQASSWVRKCDRGGGAAWPRHCTADCGISITERT